MMELNGTPIADTFAEAFPIVGTRLIVTAIDAKWVAGIGRTTAPLLQACVHPGGVAFSFILNFLNLRFKNL